MDDHLHVHSYHNYRDASRTWLPNSSEVPHDGASLESPLNPMSSAITRGSDGSRASVWVSNGRGSGSSTDGLGSGNDGRTADHAGRTLSPLRPQHLSDPAIARVSQDTYFMHPRLSVSDTVPEMANRIAPSIAQTNDAYNGIGGEHGEDTGNTSVGSFIPSFALAFPPSSTQTVVQTGRGDRRSLEGGLARAVPRTKPVWSSAALYTFFFLLLLLPLFFFFFFFFFFLFSSSVLFCLPSFLHKYPS